MSAKIPIGVEYNNYLNIRVGPSDWVGEVTRPGDAYERFDTLENGLRAASKLAVNHVRKNGANTLEKLIGVWAPPSENDTRAYVAYVSGRTGVAADQPLDLGDPHALAQLVAAMAEMEVGQSYARQVPSAVYVRAARRALGLTVETDPPDQVPDSAPLTSPPAPRSNSQIIQQSATIKTSIAGGMVGASAIGVDQLPQMLSWWERLGGLATPGRALMLLAVLLAAAVVIHRLRQHRAADREVTHAQ